MTVTVKVKFLDDTVKEYIIKDYRPTMAIQFVRSLDNVKAWKLCF